MINRPLPCSSYWQQEQLEAARRKQLRQEYGNDIEWIRQQVRERPFAHNCHDLLFLLKETDEVQIADNLRHQETGERAPD
jgi:hypothetical protein